MYTPIHYCSYFDHRYLARALCLYDSLCKYSPPFVWHVLPLTETCERLMHRLELPWVQVTTLSDLEETMPKLRQAKSNRSIVEYYFTLTSALCRFTVDQIPADTLLTYLDSDLYFFDSPQFVFDELATASIGVIEHRFSERNKERICYGRFNVGWVSFRNSSTGRKCLDDWLDQCLNWCYDKLEDDRFADQKYLDAWPGHYGGLHIIQHPGANVGPWNVSDFVAANHIHSADERRKANLIFAHFQGVRYLGFRTYDTAFDEYEVDLNLRKEICNTIYRPYLKHLRLRQRMVASMLSLEDKVQGKELRSAKTLIPLRSFSSSIRFPKWFVRMMRRYCWVMV
jgi:hypothetical protein